LAKLTNLINSQRQVLDQEPQDSDKSRQFLRQELEAKAVINSGCVRSLRAQHPDFAALNTLALRLPTPLG